MSIIPLACKAAKCFLLKLMKNYSCSRTESSLEDSTNGRKIPFSDNEICEMAFDFCM